VQPLRTQHTNHSTKTSKQFFFEKKNQKTFIRKTATLSIHYFPENGCVHATLNPPNTTRDAQGRTIILEAYATPCHRQLAAMRPP
jgi:hypothetical protein